MEPTQEEREAPEIQRQEDPSVPEPRSGRDGGHLALNDPKPPLGGGGEGEERAQGGTDRVKRGRWTKGRRGRRKIESPLREREKEKKKERKKKTGERDREMEEENLPVPLEEKRDSGGERRGGWGLL